MLAFSRMRLSPSMLLVRLATSPGVDPSGDVTRIKSGKPEPADVQLADLFQSNVPELTLFQV